MSILLIIIENLSSGGAEKQIFLLASELIKRGLSLTILTYNQSEKDFYAERLSDIGVDVVKYDLPAYTDRIFTIRNYIRLNKPFTVLSYLDGPNLLSCLVHLSLRQKFKLIVSDRTGILDNITLKDWLRYQLYRRADFLVLNNAHVARIVKKKAPWLGQKVKLIWNIAEPYNLAEINPPVNNQAGHMRIVIGASYSQFKNHKRWIRAVAHAINEYHVPASKLNIACFGNKILPGNLKYMQELQNEIALLHIDEVVKLFDETMDLKGEILNADFCSLPSLYEGCPNFIVESMMLGKPVLLSDVCSNRDIVVEEEGGYFFNPYDIKDMAKAIFKAFNTSVEERKNMGQKNALRALHLFNMEQKVNQYLELIKG